MRIIQLNAMTWKTVVDFYTSLLKAIGAPKWHGISPDALVDSMIWGGINAVEPPYTIKISGVDTLPKEIRDEVELARRVLADGRLEYQSRRGGDVAVAIEIEP